MSKAAQHHPWRASGRAVWVCFVVVACVLPSFGDEGLAARIDDLVRRLDAPTRAERIQAEQSLLGLGPTALPLLPTTPQPSAHPLNRVRRTLDARRQSELLAPVMFARPQGTEGTRIGTLLDEFQKRFGEHWSAADVPVAEREQSWMRPDQAPFWSLIAALEEQRSLVAKFEALERAGRTVDQWRLAPTEPTHERGWLIPGGTFALRVTRVGDSTSGHPRLGLQVGAQPGVRGLLTFVDARRVSLTHPDGGVRSPVSLEGRYELPWTDGGQSPRLVLEFGRPVPGEREQAATRDRLSGECEVVAAAGEDRFRFEEALVAKSTRPMIQRIGRTTSSVERAELETRLEGTRARFVVLTTRHAEAGATTTGAERIAPVVALESHQFGLVPHSARLVSRTTGREVEPTSTVRAEFFAAGTTRAEYVFEGIAEPAADWVLECATVAVIGRQRVRFEGDVSLLSETRTPKSSATK